MMYIMDIRLSQADISDHSWDFSYLVKKESFDRELSSMSDVLREWIEAFWVLGRKTAGG